MVTRKGVAGIKRVRRILKTLPDEMRGELAVELNVTGRQINQAVLAKAPRKTGATKAGISYRVLPTSLKLRVGLLGTPKERSRLFYARIQDLGRKAQDVKVAARKNRTAYTMKVRGMTGKRFITGRQPELRATLRQNLRGIFRRALARRAFANSDE